MKGTTKRNKIPKKKVEKINFLDSDFHFLWFWRIFENRKRLVRAKFWFQQWHKRPILRLFYFEHFSLKGLLLAQKCEFWFSKIRQNHKKWNSGFKNNFFPNFFLELISFGHFSLKCLLPPTNSSRFSNITAVKVRGQKIIFSESYIIYLVTAFIWYMHEKIGKQHPPEGGFWGGGG